MGTERRGETEERQKREGVEEERGRGGEKRGWQGKRRQREEKEEGGCDEKERVSVGDYP